MPNTEIGSAYVTVYPKTDGKFSQQVGNKMGSGIGQGLSAKAVALGGIVSNIAMRAADAAANAIGEVIGGAFENFADYEQLVGGVETLFKDSADVVEGYARNAYKTAGLSANQYMETVTSFSASLLQSLGGDTEAAARYADMAVTDMADNANKMGSDMASIENAYQGFAKQNYTMLDNLKLGYGGTKSEMERLLADASEIAGIEFNIDSYSDVIQAIHVMQEQMGIAGTTSKEAAETISGSAASMKSAWDNWLTSLGTSDMDVQETTAQLIESVKTYLENAIPAIGQIFLSIADVVKDGLGQIIGEENAEALFKGVSDAAQFLSEAFAPVADAIGHIAEGVGPRLQEFCTAIQPLLDGLGSVVGGVLTVAFEGLGTAITVVGDALSWVWDNILSPFIEWVSSTFGPVLETIGDAIGGIGDFVGGAMEAASGAVTTYGQTMVDTMGGDWQAMALNTSQTFSGVQSNVDTAMSAASTSASTAATKVTQAMDMTKVPTQVKSTFDQAGENMAQPVDDAVTEINAKPDEIVGAYSGLGADITAAVGSIDFPQPHTTYETVEAGDKAFKVPHISWWATGGFFDGATLIGAGEKGTEMLLPQRGRMMDMFADALTDRMGGVANSINVYLQYDAGEDASTLATDLARLLGRKLAMEA